jgi:hypothetical protein
VPAGGHSGSGSVSIVIDDGQSRQEPIQDLGDIVSTATRDQEPDAWPEDALVAIPARKPITHGLAVARDLVLDAARHQGWGRFDIIADGGCGKTRLLEELAEGLRDAGRATLFITLSPQRGNDDELSEADRMHGDEVTCHQMIADFAADVRRTYEGSAKNGWVLDQQTGPRIEKRMLAAANAMPALPVNPTTSPVGERSPAGPATERHVSAEGDAYVAGRDQIFYQGVSDIELMRLRWEASRAAFVTAMRELAEHCPVAILIDDLHRVLGTGAGRWLVGVLDQLPGIVTVHARRPDPAHDVLGHAQVVRLKPMSQEETAAYARYELPGWAPAEATELGSIVFDLTGGHPVWVGACCQMIATEMVPGAPASGVRERLLGGAVALSDEERTARFGRFVDEYCADLLGTAAPAFDLLAVLRRVSRDQLTSLFAEDGLPELAAHRLDAGACGRLFDWLRESGFMTAIDDGGLSDSGEPDIRLHDVIRHDAERQLRQRDLVWYRKLHASTERYYRTTMNFDQELEEGVTRHQYGTRYEEPEWRISSLEWLHHAGQVAEEAYPLVRRAMIRLFLDAFWWYECDFPMRNDYHYCQALLASYRALPRRRSGEQWLRYLEDFRENYVADTPNREPGQDPERWELAQDALRGLWSFLRLDRATVPDDHDLRRIQILLSIFRGDAGYYAGDEPGRDRAAAWYTEAEKAAYPDEDARWIANWARYMKADLYVSTDPSRARELVRDLPEQIDEQDDHELRVYLIWLYGDVAWAADDKPTAFDVYARAVLHAFVFHVRQEFLPQNPSSYTVEFYQMFVDWTRQRLDEARQDGLTELAGTATGRMNALFAPYWRRVGHVPDNAEGFPAQPAPGDLGTIDSRFTETVLWMLEAMKGRLEEPLDGPLLLA